WTCRHLPTPQSTCSIASNSSRPATISAANSGLIFPRPAKRSNRLLRRLPAIQRLFREVPLLLYALVHAIKPFADQRLEELALLDMNVVAGTIQYGKSCSWVVLQKAPGIAISSHMILPSRKDYDR